VLNFPCHKNAALATDHHLSIKSLLPNSTPKIVRSIPPRFYPPTSCPLSVRASKESQYGCSTKAENKPSRRSESKARRRRKSLFKKASEYSSECDADIHLVLRMKKSGKIFVLVSNTKDWPLSQHQLVSSLHHRSRRQKGTKLISRSTIILHPFKCL
jgi:hypothetical protein